MKSAKCVASVALGLLVSASPSLAVSKPVKGDGTETRTPVVKSLPPTNRVPSASSRQHVFKWPLPLTLNSGIWGTTPYAQRVKNLTLTEIEQIGANNKPLSTSYIVDFDFFNQTEDDKYNTNRVWTFNLVNSTGVSVDAFNVSLNAYCSKQGYEHFRLNVPSQNNFFDIAALATVQGVKPGGYEGGCGYPGGDRRKRKPRK